MRSLPDQLPPGILPDHAVARQSLRFLESDHRSFGIIPEIAVDVGGLIAAADEECLGAADDGAAGAGADGRQRVAVLVRLKAADEDQEFFSVSPIARMMSPSSRPNTSMGTRPSSVRR